MRAFSGSMNALLCCWLLKRDACHSVEQLRQAVTGQTTAAAAAFCQLLQWLVLVNTFFSSPVSCRTFCYVRMLWNTLVAYILVRWMQQQCWKLCVWLPREYSISTGRGRVDLGQRYVHCIWLVVFQFVLWTLSVKACALEIWISSVCHVTTALLPDR